MPGPDSFPRPPSPRRSSATACLVAALAYPLAAATLDVAAFETRIAGAERNLELGDYPTAGQAARRVLATGAAPDALRGRALTVLGKVLFFNSRAPFGPGPESDAEANSRRQGLELAEQALRDAAAIEGPAAPEARLYLAELLWTVGRTGESRAVIDEYFAAPPAGPVDPRADHLRGCLDTFRRAVPPGAREPRAESGDPGSESGMPAEPEPLSDLIVAPKRLVSEDPSYTEAARDARIVGKVVVQVVVGREGDVLCPKVLVGLPLGLTESALDAISTWRFEPATFRGSPIAVLYNLSVSYRLDPPL